MPSWPSCRARRAWTSIPRACSISSRSRWLPCSGRPSSERRLRVSLTRADHISPVTPIVPPAIRRCAHGRIGVLLLNLGTPDATDYWSMRRYLKEFLSDRRVIEVPRWKWWPILNRIILTVRPGRKGRDYAKIWNKERNEGPLKTITRAQAEKLAARCWAMRASSSTGPCAMPTRPPRARSRRLQAQGCDRILLVPLYPQYAAATTATACDQAFRALMRDALAAGRARGAAVLRGAGLHRRAGAVGRATHLATLDFEPEVLLASLPRHAAERICERGRSLSLPVPEDLAAAARDAGLARRALAHDLPVALRQRSVAAALHRSIPSTRLAKSGTKRLADRGARLFRRLPGDARGARRREPRPCSWRNGGEQFTYIPCLNDSDDGMRVIEHVVRRELVGWA